MNMTPWLKAAALAGAAAILAATTALPARAQTLPSEPIVFGNGHVTLGGDVSVTFAPQDPGFFNYTDYEHSALRLFRARSDGVGQGRRPPLVSRASCGPRTSTARRAYALYARIRPWTNRAFDIQVGRIPPTFGAFARRTYAVGQPADRLSARLSVPRRRCAPTAVPANADELLRMRGRGWLSNYSIGNQTPAHGVPLVERVHVGHRRPGARGERPRRRHRRRSRPARSSNPLCQRRQRRQAGRRTRRVPPAAGPRRRRVGGARPVRQRRPRRAARSATATTATFTQTAWGADVEYSRDYYLVRVETIVSDWTLPIVRPPVLDLPLRALVDVVEGRYKIRPGLYAAARVDHLGFSEVTGTSGTADVGRAASPASKSAAATRSSATCC